MKNIFGFGSATIDFRIQTADYGPNYTDKLIAQETQLFGGGAVANFLVQIARLGGKAFWLGKLGNDWIGQKIIESMIVEGVDCSRAVIDKNSCSPFNVAIYAGEKRRRVGGYLLPNSLAELNEQELKQFASYVSDGDFILFEIGEIPFLKMMIFLDQLAEKQVHVVMDIDLDPVKQCCENNITIDELFRRADYLIPNVKAMSSLYPDTSIEDLAQIIANQYQVPTIITAGHQGAFFCEGHQVFHEPAELVEIVDTVGAGDAFHGGFVYALSEGMDISNAVKLGIRCGSFNCEKTGTREGMPWGDDERLIR